MSSHRCPARRIRTSTFYPVGRLLRPLLTLMAVLTLGIAPLALLGPASVAYAAGDLTVLVYNDGGRDGLYADDASHPGVSSAEVAIYSSDNMLVGLANTSKTGRATFPDLADGTYRLEVRPPANFVVSLPGSDNRGLVSFVTISGGGASVRVGLRPLSSGADLVARAGTRSIVMRLWDDLNGNGVQDAGEPGLAAQTLDLIDSSNVVLQTATALSDGRYHFPAAPITAGLSVRVRDGVPATYALTRFKVNDGNAFPGARDSDAAPALLPRVVASLPETLRGVNDDSIAIGFTRGAVSGFVWRDSNANGQLNLSEARLNGVTVQLIDASDAVVAVTTTRSELGPDGQPGFYNFSGLMLDMAYRIRIPSSQFEPGGPFVGAANSPYHPDGDQATPDGLASGNNVEIAFTPTGTNIASGSHLNNLARFGFYQGSIGDFVWLDLDRDGVVDDDPTETNLGQNGLRLFIDLNVNGALDADEPVTITRDSPFTSSPGYYSFDSLPLGVGYRVALDPAQFAAGGALEGFGVSPNVTEGAHPPDYFYRESGLLAVSPDHNDPATDFGLTRASVGNVVFYDVNGNGVRDLVGDPPTLEPGLPGVTVRIYRATTDALVGEFETDEEGKYSIPNLPSVNYYATFDLSFVDEIFTNLVGSPIELARGVNPGELGAAPGDPADTNDYSDLQAEPVDLDALIWRTPNFVPLVGIVNNGVDAAFYELTSLTGRAFFDSNDDGLDSFTTPEPAMRAVTVRLLRAAVEVASTTTDATGVYSFENVAPGLYTLAFTNPAPATFEFIAQDLNADNPMKSQIDPTTGATAICLCADIPLDEVRAGFRGRGVLEGLLFADVDGSATQSQTSGAEDTPLTGNAALTVTANLPNLFATYNPVVDTSLTPLPFGAPNYRVSNLVAGTGVSYSLTFTPPDSSYVATLANVGGDEAIDSDGPLNGSALVISNPIIGPAPFDYDQGYYQPVTVSARVFEDRSLPANNQWDSGEPGFTGATVRLVYSGPLTASDWGARLPSAPLAPDSTGLATFTSLPPGAYGLEATAPTGYLPATGHTGTLTLGTLTSGGDALTEATAPGTTNVFGYYQPATVSGVVFFDRNQDNLLANEPPMTGVTVRLLDDTGAPLTPNRTASTDSNGAYSFANVLPGAYIVEFDNPDPTNFGYSTDVDADNHVASLDGVNGRTSAFSVIPGGSATRNAAVVGTKAITGLVFVDRNGDGQASGELALANASVSLSHVVVLPNLNTTIVRTLVATAPDGQYSFASLPGTGTGSGFTLSFSPPTGASPPWTATITNVGDDASDSDGSTVTGTLDAAASNPVYDQGYYQPVTVSARVFEDRSLPANNQWDSGEPGFTGATVRLVYSGPLTASDWGARLPSAPLAPDSTGLATFTSLPPGAYGLEATAPTGYLPATGHTGTLTLGTLASGGNALTEATAPGTTNVFGYYQPATVSGVVFFDRNQDNLLASEPPMTGVTVRLLDNTGAPFTPDRTTTTTNTGAYSFTNQLPGSYIIEFANPDATNFAYRSGAAGDNSVTGLAGANGRTSAFSVTAGGSATRNAAVVGLGSIEGAVWVDQNADGSRTLDDAGLANASVSLRLSVSLPNLNTTIERMLAATGSDGTYSFAGLPSGTITSLTFTPPVATPVWNATTVTLDSNGATATGATFTANGPAATAYSQGYYQNVTIVARVFNEQVAVNNAFDAGEAGLGGIAVTLSADGSPQQRTTDANGLATFTVRPGASFELSVPLPVGFTAAPGNTGLVSLGVLNSGASNASDPTPFGYYMPSMITGTAWFDSNRDGLLADDEPPMQGLEVTLRGISGATETTVATWPATGTAGDYSFANVDPTGLTYTGYRICFALPTGFAATTRGAALTTEENSDLNADGCTDSFTLGSNSNLTYIDAGYTGLASIGGVVFADLNADGLQAAGEPGLAEAVVTVEVTSTGINSLNPRLTLSATSTTTGYLIAGVPPASSYRVVRVTPPLGYLPSTPIMTDPVVEALPPAVTALDFGFYATTTVGDLVWLDLNGNGRFDQGEPGVPGVRVELRAADAAVLDTTITNQAGGYTFDELDPGTYSLRFIAPAGYSFTNAGAGSLTVDGDNDAGLDGTTSQFTLASGDIVGSVDAGLRGTARIAGLVWVDENRNSLRDATELGRLPAIGVALSLKVAGMDAPIAVDVMTGADGRYSFDGLPAGVATLSFATPAGYTPVRQNVSTNDTLDSDGPVATFALAAGAALNNLDQGYFLAKRVVYLPLVMRPAGQPDLMVSFSVTPTSPQAFSPASIRVTVTNRGSAPASNFWVDFYLNPSKAPAVNEPWNELCGLTPCEGLAWFYSGVLEPGASVVLNSAPRTVSNLNGYVPEASIWSGAFANGVSQLFVYVDSWNRNASGSIRDPRGAVAESDETNNRAVQALGVTPGTPPASTAQLRSRLVLDRNLLQP